MKQVFNGDDNDDLYGSLVNQSRPQHHVLNRFAVDNKSLRSKVASEWGNAEKSSKLAKPEKVKSVFKR